MKCAYFDCFSGASGDMTLAALVDAGCPIDVLQELVDKLGLPGVSIRVETVRPHGLAAARVHVELGPETGHKHRHLPRIIEIIDRAGIAPRAADRAKAVFARLAEAEAAVHGSSIEKVHFHEVGAVDSIADIVGSAIGFNLLGIERVICSPVPTGRGYIEIAHGRCSIPAPATGELLRGVPLAALDVEGELTTPTGAAIVAALADEFGPLPAMTVDRIGYGAGQKDFPQPNILRLLVGEPAAKPHAAGVRPRVEAIVVLETNLDNASGETIGHAVDRLWAAGALDVSLTAIQMKKGRPGVLMSVQARPADADHLEAVLFTETPTLGVRRQTVLRTVLVREPHEVTTRWGPIAGKVSHLPDGSKRFTPEYEACRELAKRNKLSLVEVMAIAQQAFRG